MTAKTISPTPTFMRLAITAWRKDYLLAWAIYETGREHNMERREAFEWVCNRPKTPAFDHGNWEVKSMARRWLARNFRPVSDALFDGATDAEAIRVWIKTDRHDSGPDREAYPNRNALRDRLIIHSRALAPKNGSFFRVR